MMNDNDDKKLEEQAEYLCKILGNVIDCHKYSEKVVFLTLASMFFVACENFNLTRSEIINIVKQHCQYMDKVKNKTQGFKSE